MQLYFFAIIHFITCLKNAIIFYCDAIIFIAIYWNAIIFIATSHALITGLTSAGLAQARPNYE